jgi:transcriptional regulator with XRE-family HTH domain
MLADRIRERRRERKLSQAALARRLGVTQGSVALMESGRRSPSLELLPKLAEALGLSVEYLLKGEEAAVVDVGALNAADRRLVRRFAEFLFSEGASPRSASKPGSGKV